MLRPSARRRRAAAEKPDEKSIAILPFTNRSSDEENQYLCDGLAEELIGGFAKMQDLRVASQVSTFALKNQNFDIETIGAKLRVNHVLSGSVQKSGNRVRVSVSLTDVRSGDAVWSERYDGTLDDVFGLQEAVARKVVDALQVRLGAAEAAAPLIDAGTRNPQAYNAFLLGMHAFRKRASATSSRRWIIFSRPARWTRTSAARIGSISSAI